MSRQHLPLRQPGISFGKALASALFFLAVLACFWSVAPEAQAQSATDLVITVALPPAATSGSTYSYTFAASGGTPPYTWSGSLVSPDRTSSTTWFDNGAILNGMSLDAATGILSGAPFYSGTYPLRIRVTDANFRRMSLALEFKVNGSGSSRTITNAPPPGIAGSAYSFRFATTWTSILGCDPNIYFIEGSLPPGLSLNVLSGDIGQPPAAYGTPQAAGTYTFTVASFTNLFCVPSPTETNAWTYSIAIASSSSVSPPSGATNWSRHASNPLLSPAASGWDSNKIASPSVVKTASGYMMYYEAQDTTTYTWRIGLATSSDGITWSKSSANPVLSTGAAGAWDSLEVRYPSVHYDGSTFRMWYWGRDSIDGVAKIGLATSSNGITWSKRTSPVLGTAYGGEGFAPGSVIRSGSQFVMWYLTPYGDIQRTTSSDGITWSSAQTVLSNTAISRPVVILDSGTYRMWFGKWDSGDNGGFASSSSDEARLNVGSASSPDGISWTAYQYTPSLCSFCLSTDSLVPSLPIGVAGTWDRPGVGQPWVILDGNQYKMWYTGGRIHRPQVNSLNALPFVEGAIGYATNGSGSTPPTSSSTRNAWFVNASTSTNKTSVLRVVNPNSSAGSLTATAYDESGNVVGSAAAPLGTIGAQQMLTFTSAQLEAAIGYNPSASTAKYRMVFSANLATFEVINFVKDVATGNLTLAQAQTDSRAAGSASTSTRNAWFVNASTSTNKTSVLRVVNPNGSTGSLTATAYDESGNVVGSAAAPLGTIGAQQMLTFTSAQLEAAISYNPSASTAKYRMVFSANLATFEVINFVKDVATGNLTLAQAQTDSRAAGSASTSTRNAWFVNASTSTNKTSVLRVVNPNSSTGSLTATAYDESGNVVGSAAAPLGTIGAQQMLTFTSAQLEAAIGYNPSASTAKYRMVFSANLATFEVINFVKDVATGNLTLAQAQTDDTQ